jgi:hypothetical protein
MKDDREQERKGRKGRITGEDRWSRDGLVKRVRFEVALLLTESYSNGIEVDMREVKRYIAMCG